ncbi:MAG: alginate export family protein [Pseudomonadota bacterium]|nr:alginate export family protein [Pseudomonadota bacterium]
MPLSRPQGQSTARPLVRIVPMAAAIATAALTQAMPAIAETPGFTLSGETRLRYETLDGQFRAGGSGGDQALFSRSLLHAQYDTGPVALGVELQDSRSWLDDSGTPLSSSYVNPLDILQLYARIDMPSLLIGEGEASLTLGRQTVSIGSKRQIERVSYANVIKNYTGFHYETSNARGDEFHLVAVVPISRLPRDRTALGDNELEADEEEWNRRIWAAHYRRADIFPSLASDIMGEAFVYGLTERDTADVPTPNRQYVAPGFRLYRAPQTGQWDMDIEGVWRLGRRRATRDADDTESLDVSATMLFAAVGYTFDLPWQPRLAAEYYWASGDEDPDDGRFDQYERLFGSRRTDLNNTSLHGPLTPANLSAPGVRLELEPGPRWEGRIAWSAASLASETDAWVIARLRDPSGQSGRFLGHTLDGRLRHHPVPDRVELSVGASAFFAGEFPGNVPGGPGTDTTLLGYGQVVLSF